MCFDAITRQYLRQARPTDERADYLDAAPVVVAVARDIDLPPVEGTLPRRPADPDALAALAAAHGIESSLKRLGAALGWPEDALS